MVVDSSGFTVVFLLAADTIILAVDSCLGYS